MSFLKKLFKPKPYVDKNGLYFYVVCDNCGGRVKIRADKQHDLNRSAGTAVWHKTIVDSKCFRPMPTVVHLDDNYQVVSAEIKGGHYVTEAEWQRLEEEEARGKRNKSGDGDAGFGD